MNPQTRERFNAICPLRPPTSRAPVKAIMVRLTNDDGDTAEFHAFNPADGITPEERSFLQTIPELLNDGGHTQPPVHPQGVSSEYAIITVIVLFLILLLLAAFSA
jgi:hypothetical protein